MTALFDAPIPTDLPVQQYDVYSHPFEITEPGVYSIASETYHRDPVPDGSLSSSGARKLLHPGCPAIFEYERRHPSPPTDAMEFGTALHAIVLENGSRVEVVDAKSWQSKSARDERDAIRAAGGVALLPAQHKAALEMAAAVRRHPIASRLFDPERGQAERSLFWRDPVTGVMLRARPDFLPDPVDGERLIVPDLKSAKAVDKESIGKANFEYGYPCQADFYESGIKALGIAQDVAFLFVHVMKTPPYLVQVAGIPEIDRLIAAAKNRRAIDLYAQCMKRDKWPPYEEGIAYIDTPGWAQSREASEYL